MPLIRIKKEEINSEITYIKEIKEYLVFLGGRFKLVPALCKHEGAPLPAITVDGCVTCPKHGWILDVKNSIYVNPHNLAHSYSSHLLQEDDSFLYISKKVNTIDSVKQREDYKFSSVMFDDSRLLKFRYINHACAVLKSNHVSIVTDPWLMGSAFSTGWFLKKKTPSHAIQDVLSSTYCYISHSHPDHLNPTTLIYLKKLNWDPTFIIPHFNKSDLTRQMIESFGYTKFIALGNKDTFTFNEQPEIQLEMRFDQSGRNDSGVIVRYGSTTLVNMVDAPNLDLSDIESIDIALIPFANGASGYPACWEDLFGEAKINETKRLGNLSTLNNINEFCKKYKPKCVIPFAGYFYSPLPEDSRIDYLNTKNSPSDVDKLLGKKFIVVDPESNDEDRRVGNFLLCRSIHDMQGRQSLQSLSIDYACEFRDMLCERYDNFYKHELVEFLERQGFCDDLVVDFQVHDIDFQKMHFNLIWDFSSNQELTSLPDFESSKNLRYLRLKLRRYSLAYTLRNGLPWEEFSIGFQARFTRHPNVYNFSFWDYFQNSFAPNVKIYEDLSAIYKNLPPESPIFTSQLTHAREC